MIVQHGAWVWVRMRLIYVEELERRRMLSASFDITGLTALRATPAYSSVDGSGIGVAIIDTGADDQHPDLRNNFAAFFNAVTGNPANPPDTNIADSFDPEGHGTHVSGIAASSNPTIGVATAARLIDIHALPGPNEAQPSFDPVANGLQWVIDHYAQFNIKVVNMSIGVPSVNDNFTPAADQESNDIAQLQRLGITVVSASGNNYADFAPNPGSEIPAAYSTLSVANTWATTGTAGEFPLITGSGGNVSYFAQENDAAPDRFAATSQRATTPNEIAAPGMDILSTWPAGQYQTDSGTSMASPFISGVVALMQDAAFTFGGRYLLPSEVVTLIRSSADTITDSNVASNSRVPITFDSNGNPHRAGSNQDLPETGLTFKRVNVLRAIQFVQSFVQTGIANPTPPSNPTADTNNTIATAIQVSSLNGTQILDFNGNIGTDGTVAIGANDVDLYQVTLDSPGFVTFGLSLPTGGISFSAQARLFDATGNEIVGAQVTFNSGYPTMTTPPLSPGTYYFGVSAFGNAAYFAQNGAGASGGTSTGDYSLAISLSNPDPNGVIQGAAQIDLTAPDIIDPYTNLPADFEGGIIGSDPNPLDAAGPRIQIGPTDVDFFSFIAPDDGVVTFKTDAKSSAAHQLDGVDTFIVAYNSNLQTVGFNDDISYPSNTDSFLQIQVSAGQTYYLAVTTYGNRGFDPTNPFNRSSTSNETGKYDLYTYFTSNDTNGTIFTASPMTIGSSADANIGTDNGVVVGSAGGSKDVDFYSFTAASDGLFDVTASTSKSGFQPVLTLWQLITGQTNSIQKLETSSPSNPHLVAQITSGEKFFVSVSGKNNNNFTWFAPASGSGGQVGPYHLATRLRSPSDLPAINNDSIQNGTPTPITLDAPVLANLGVDGGLLRWTSDIDLYSFVSPFTGLLIARASASSDASTDPFLRAFDSSGNELAFNDNADANTRNSEVSFEVEAGKMYYVGVNASSANSRNYNPLTGAGASSGTGGDYILSLSPPPTISVTSPNPIQKPNSGTANVVFNVALSQPAPRDVTVDYATADGFARANMDYLPASGTLTVPTGQTSASVTVQIIGNLTFVAPESFSLVLSNPTNAFLTTPATPATILSQRAIPVPGTFDLSATSLQAKYRGTLLPSSPISAKLTISNVSDGALMNSTFSTQFFISTDPTYSPDDVLVAMAKRRVGAFMPNKTFTIAPSFRIPKTLAAGTYYIVGVVDPGKTLHEVDITDNTAASAAFPVVYQFGNVPGRGNTRLTLTGAGNVPITFALSGKGLGTVTVQPFGGLSVTLVNTTKTSIATFSTPRRAVASLIDVTVDGSLQSLLAPDVDLLGSLVATGNIKKAVFHNR